MSQSVAPPGEKDRSGLLLMGVLGAVIFSYLLTAWFTARQNAQLNALSNTIIAELAPNIQRLAAIRGHVLEVELTLSRYITEDTTLRVATGEYLTQSLKTLERSLEQYAATPPGLLLNQIHLHLARLGANVQEARDEVDAGRSLEGRRIFHTEVLPTASKVVASAMRAIDANALRGQEHAQRIQEIRAHTLLVSRVLTGASVLLALLGALMIRRIVRRRLALEQNYSAFLLERSAELEQFAGRVAHDIRNPISAAKLSSELIIRKSADPSSKEQAQRIVRALQRVDEITTDLLNFARAGAKADPGARTDVSEMMSDFQQAMEPSVEAARVDLRIFPVPPVLVACGSGVYLSALQNLVQNAIKYMGNSTTREISVRVMDEGDSVRTTVTDSGPGIAPESLPFLFKPYFRVGGSAQAGLGLGLATVKRLVDGHHGEVGVVSEPGRGSTFWFSLPKAGYLHDIEAAPEAGSALHH